MTTTAIEPTRAPFPQPASRVLLKVADLESLPESVSGVPVSWELHDGVPIPMSPPGYRHCRIAAKIVRELLNQGEDAGFGEAGDEVNVVLARDPDRVLGPDAVYVAQQSLPAKISREGYLETIPAIVVEVRSKNDTMPEVEAKVEKFLAAGVTVVWVADPGTKTVTAYRSNQPQQVFAATDELTVPDIIPPFRVKVEKLFPKV